MTDLEITRLCAEAYFDSGKRMISCIGDVAYVEPYCEVDAIRYDPLHDDAQAMALVKKMRLDIDSEWPGRDRWIVMGTGGFASSDDLNRAICECVADMQKKHD